MIPGGRPANQTKKKKRINKYGEKKTLGMTYVIKDDDGGGGGG